MLHEDHEEGRTVEPQLSKIHIYCSKDENLVHKDRKIESYQPDHKVICSRSHTISRRHQPTQLSNLHNLTCEGAAFIKVYLNVRLNDIRNKRPYDALTTAGRFNHYLVDPLSKWYGNNNRILTSASLAQVGILSTDESIQKVINCGSHNYAGFYPMSDGDLKLHQLCLEKLPVADVTAVSFLHEKMLDGLANLWNAKCCFSTATGYQSNMLGIPAIAGKGWLLLLDEKSHNSIFTACYLAGADAIKRFKHNDMESLKRLLENARTSGEHTDILVIVEGLYSMDGTIPLLGSLRELKGAFGFVLYVDEAHSFGSIGKTGKGILELWNDEHPGDAVPLDLIDVRAGSLSKTVGGLGGFVCATSKRFDRALQNRWEDSQQRDGGTLATSTILQTLSFLAQPKRIQGNLLRLKNISTFCHDELKRQGIFVYGEEELSHLPILPIFGGRPSKAAKLSFVLRKCGVAAAPVSTPAVDIWESRVRITLSPSYTDTDVNNLITAIITASRQIGLGKRCHIPGRIYYSTQKLRADDVAGEKIQALLDLSTLVNRQADQTSADKAFKFLDQTVIDAGSAAQRQYGIGSGAARWVLGTFQPHLNVEEKIAQLADQPSALTYPSSSLGLMSTIAALCRPIIGAKNHYFLIPANVSKSVEEGLRAASTKSRTVAIRYTDVESLVPLFVALARPRDTYISLYIQLYQNGHYIDLAQLAKRLHNELPRSHRRFTILLDDSHGPGLHGSQTLRISRKVDLGRFRNLLSAQILIIGCFMNDFGLPGGWLAGSSELIEEFRLTSRGYMFSTSPMPFIMAMIEQSLLSLL